MTNKKQKVIGIDPSLGGFAAYRCDGKSWEGASDKIGDGIYARADRIEELLREFIPWVVLYKPSVIVVEGYFGQLNQVTLRLLELGWDLRRRLANHAKLGAVLYEVPPTTMKKLITGKGNAKKPLIVSTLAVKYGITFANDNLADAFGLMQVGRMLAKEVAVPKEHAAMIKEIKRASV